MQVQGVFDNLYDHACRFSGVPSMVQIFSVSRLIQQHANSQPIKWKIKMTSLDNHVHGVGFGPLSDTRGDGQLGDETSQLRVTVKKPLLRWAMERSSKSAEELAKIQGMQKIKVWLSGDSKPTLRQLEKFATATSTPFGYLFMSKPPKEQLSIPHFRTLTNDTTTRPSPDLIDTVRIMERRQDWMREYLIDMGAEPLKFVDSSKQTDPHKHTAGKIRDVLGLAENWAAGHPNWNVAQTELRHKMEKAGIIVSVNGVVGSNVHRKLNPAEFRGFVLVDNYAPFIFVNNADGKGAQMFTLAHELAHIWLGRSAAFDLYRLTPAKDDIEVACNRIAAELLVTEEEMRRNWSKFAKALDPYREASRHFKVSRIVVARRALDTNRISQETFNKFYTRYEKLERQKQDADKSGGGDFYRTAKLRIGKKFADSVITAADEGRILYRAAYRLTGLKSESFDKLKVQLRSED